MTEVRSGFLAPRVRSARTGLWQSWPWWSALPLAVLFGAVAFWAHANVTEPLRPDVGYVVGQTGPDTCKVGIASSTRTSAPEFVVSGEDTLGSCNAYETGRRVYFDADAPRSPPGASSGDDNGAVLTGALGVIAALFVLAAVHDVVLRRRQLTAPASRVRRPSHRS